MSAAHVSVAAKRIAVLVSMIAFPFVDRGRDTRRRVPPAQIPASGFPAQGSSETLASAFDLLFPTGRFAQSCGLSYPLHVSFIGYVFRSSLPRASGL